MLPTGGTAKQMMDVIQLKTNPEGKEGVCLPSYLLSGRGAAQAGKGSKHSPHKSRKEETSSVVAARVTPAEAICEALSFRSSYCKLRLTQMQLS